MSAERAWEARSTSWGRSWAPSELTQLVNATVDGLPRRAHLPSGHGVAMAVHPRDQGRIGIAVEELAVPEPGRSHLHGVHVEKRHEHVEANDTRTKLVQYRLESGGR